MIVEVIIENNGNEARFTVELSRVPCHEERIELGDRHLRVELVVHKAYSAGCFNKHTNSAAEVWTTELE